MSENNDILSEVSQILHTRKSAEPNSSYAASLYNKGLDAILKKVGEEATEVVMAAKDIEADSTNNKDKSKLVYEVADLWFHTLVLLEQQDLHPNDVLQELDRRMGTSGITEKASRSK